MQRAITLECVPLTLETDLKERKDVKGEDSVLIKP